MTKRNFTIADLWQVRNFTPNPNQEQAILHTDGPLYLPAGPGSGKTRVLLWRTINLIVFHDVPPDEIYLSTFTQKAALQLKEGLRALLGIATNYNDVQYDIGNMYVGTVHSLCLRLITDRRFSSDRSRSNTPALLDEIDQYFHIARRRHWDHFLDVAQFADDGVELINDYFGRASKSKFVAIQHCIDAFNRFSEECFDPGAVRAQTGDPVLQQILDLYAAYLDNLASGQEVPVTDLSLLQQKALETLASFPGAGNVFRHVIIDEYQDTNTVQERLFFQLASGHKNLCVVGDDDQALYRFRGATVENFVQFPQRCQHRLGVQPTVIPLSVNYRSRKRIVHFYGRFIDSCDWRKDGKPRESYRVTAKDIHPHRKDAQPSVIATTSGKPVDVFPQIAQLVRQLIDQGKVQDPNQIAFLFPSLKSVQVRRMEAALEAEGLLVYAPRAGRFLEVGEAVATFGVMFHIFGKPKRRDFRGRDYSDFHDWLQTAYDTAEQIIASDAHLQGYVEDRQEEIAAVVDDYDALLQVIDQRNWHLQDPYNPSAMKRALHQAPGLSNPAKASLANTYLDRLIQRRAQQGKPPFTLGYIIGRATALDWTVLDVFYRLCGFGHFRQMFDLAEHGKDEGPICNLGLISQYLARFVDQHSHVITANILSDNNFRRLFVSYYLYVLFRMGESKYEDAEDPFPKGRIPFLTIHQAKGLEFPVVVLANPCKRDRGPQRVEEIVHPLLDREGEPLDRLSEFDIMRLFYVALSRPKNLLVIAHLRGQGIALHKAIRPLLDDTITRIPDFDVSTVPVAKPADDDLPKTYSYTGDYLLYQKCPRQYMIFRKYGFVPSRSQFMFFGSLVHQTLEDLHHFLINRRVPA